jgi:asparagine synthase (glutamine-hydrolysing)
MCGIVGGLSPRGAAPDMDNLRRMAAALAHRGPDDEGFFSDGPCALGFRRLSIIDLGGGHQPITSPDGRHTIVFNGEAYNYRAVRAELEALGARFRTQSDTEVVLAAVGQWGADALSRLNGMFAFAVWDAREQRLFLARDRFGKKPLYFARTGGQFVFASEIKSLLAHPGLSARVDPSRVPAFVAYRYVPGDETLFEGIRCLQPGCMMEVTPDRGAGAQTRWWDYSFAMPDAPPADGDGLRAELRALLDDSVRLRMISDVPFGAFLSGGVDSSLIVALMSRLHPEPIRTFSIGFDTGFSEAPLARAVAERFRCDHHEITVGSRELIAAIPRALWFRESPVTEPSDIPIFLLSELARTKVTVVLSGEGSDEVLAGYPKYAFEDLIRRRFGFVPPGAASALARVLPFGMRRARLALECMAQKDPLERHAAWFGGFPAAERARLLAPAGGAEPDVHAFAREALAGRRFPSGLEEMLYLDTRHWLPANLLLRGDRMTMGNSLELRCPFLDWRLAEFAAARVPRRLKVRGFEGKVILKQLAEELLPPEVVHRRKWGFRVPVGEWFRGALAPVLRATLLGERAMARGWFRPAEVKRLVDAHLSGRTNYEKQLWILFQLELWHLMFIDGVLKPGDSLQ